MEQKTSQYILYGGLGVLIAVTFSVIGYRLGISNVDSSNITQNPSVDVIEQTLFEEVNTSSVVGIKETYDIPSKVKKDEREIKFPAISYKQGEWDIRKETLDSSPGWQTTYVLKRIELASSNGEIISLIHDCEGELLANAGNYGYGELICFGQNYLGYFYEDVWHQIASYKVNGIDDIVFLEDALLKSTASGQEKLFIVFDNNSALGYQGLSSNPSHLTHVVDLDTHKVNLLFNSPMFWHIDSSFYFDTTLDQAFVFLGCAEGCPEEAFYYFDLVADTSRPIIYYRDFSEDKHPFTPTTSSVKWLDSETVDVMGTIFKTSVQ